MDPLSITASLVALLQISNSIIQYLAELGGATTERLRLLMDLSNTTMLLSMLKDAAQNEDKPGEWRSTLQGLEGPLKQFKDLLERIAGKLAPAHGMKKIGKVITWPFKKEELSDMFASLERYKTLLGLAMQNDHIQLSKALKGDVAELKHGLKAAKDKEEIEAFRNIRDWLSPINEQATQADILQRREPETGEWFLQSDEFQNWASCDRGVLWCPGIPGAGKTMLTSIAVDYLSEQARACGDVGVAWLYCNYKDPSTQMVPQMLGSICRQLLPSGRSSNQDAKCQTLVCVEKYKDRCKSGVGPSIPELVEILNAMIRSYRTAYIIIDALDECSNENGVRAEFVSALQNLQIESTNLKVLITSRYFESIARLIGSPLRLKPGKVTYDDADYDSYDLLSYVRTSESFTIHGQDSAESLVDLGPVRIVNSSSDIFRPVEREHLSEPLNPGETTPELAAVSLQQKTADCQDRQIDPSEVEVEPPKMYGLEITARNSDIEKYVAGAINRSERLSRHVRADPGLRHFIAEKVVARCQEMFLLARLHMDSLSTKPNRKAVRDALEKLPDQLDGTYDEAMRRIESQNSDDRRIAERVLGWISFAKRPLSLLELQHALATEPGSARFDEDNVVDQELITSTCAGLVTIDEESSLVRLVHYSTQEYFARNCHGRFPTAEFEISEACLTYLMYPFEGESQAPLYQYAQKYVGAHVRGERELALQDLVVACLWHLQTRINEAAQSCRLASSQRVSPLVLALAVGCTKTACSIIDQGSDWNEPFLMYGDPRNAAADESLFEYFMPVGGMLELKPYTFTSTPLHLAILRSYNDVAARLLTSGVSINAVINGSAAIHLAVETDNKEILCLLVAKNADINLQNGVGEVALQIALARRRMGLASVLLEHGASPDAGNGVPAIYLAASLTEHDQAQKAVHELLAKGADPNGRERYSPLEKARMEKNLQVMELLISHGADPFLDLEYIRDAQPSPSRLAQQLLSGGFVDSGTRRCYFTYNGEEFLTSFQVAVAAGHEARVRMLLQSGSYERSFQYLGSPLLIAISFGRRTIFDLLLDYTTDIDTTHAGQGTALQYAVRKGDTYLVSSLLEKGADVNKVGGEYAQDSTFRLTPLAMSVNCDDTSIFEELYSYGAFVDEEHGTSVPQLLALSRKSKKAMPPTLRWLEQQGQTSNMLIPEKSDKTS